ncbi:MAG TPA: class I SAM-dependent methyltransferase [Terriglobia bacterium]|nr:class I SAM-dependent methyltransferase [Terriglobia bacterium]
MPQIEDRKLKEQELHDHLRSDLASDPYYTSNKKFYSISRSNNDYVKQWIAARCPGKRVLDYCCGNGQHTFSLAEAGADAYGIDISPASIEIASAESARRGLNDRMQFLVMDAEATEFPGSFFDLVVVSGVLHHLDLDRAYQELARILKPGGEIICTEALRHNPFIHLYRKMTPHLRSAWETRHILGRSEIARARRYFDGVEVARFFHLASLAAIPFRNSATFNPLLHALESVDSVLLRLPVVKWQAWMAVFVLSRPKKP